MPTFDIHARHHDDEGEVIDPAALADWNGQLLEAFEASDQARQLPAVEWVDVLADFAHQYFGCTVAGLAPEDYQEIVLELIPRKIAVDPSEGPAIVAEFVAFWTWAKQVHKLPQAETCLQVLPSDAGPRMVQELGDRGRWGMAKGLIMQGAEAGIDVHSEEGLASWMNQLMGPAGAAGKTADSTTHSARRKSKKKKRKQQKKARRKNRK